MRWLIIYFGIIKFSYSSQHPKDLLLIPSLNNAEYTKPEKSKKKASGSLGLRGTGISLTVINVLRSAPWWEAKRSWDQSIYARQKAFSWATGIEWLSCNCLALTMHQATCKMVEVNRRSRINKKTSLNLTIQLVFCAFHINFWSEWRGLNVRRYHPNAIRKGQKAIISYKKG